MTAIVLGVIVVAPHSAAAQVMPGESVGVVAGSEREALRRAAVTDQPVEVMAERTEMSQVFAQPDGRLSLEVGVVPERVRQADGSWRSVDLGLEPGSDGLLRPRSSVADVAFSANGSNPIAQVSRGGHTLTLSWPLGALRAPTVAEDAATYSNVFPDVDLVVRATRTGFSHVLVVKTKAAADTDAVRRLRFDLGGDAQVERLGDGTLQAVAGDMTVASAGAPAMWDSSAGAAKSAKSAGTRADATLPASTSSTPGDAAQTAPVTTEIDSSGDLILKPDPGLLSSTTTTFPLFIDPSWDPGKNRWAYATSNNSNNGDVTVARVGADPNSGKKYRSFFEFKISTVAKAHIESAYLHTALQHSYSCDSTPVYLYQSGTISATPRTSWSTKLVKRIASASAHAHKSTKGTCEDDPQPDVDVNFRDSLITSLVQSQANGSASTVTVGLCGCYDTSGSGESEETKWKKFTPGSTKLIVDYDHAPGIPGSLQVGLSGSGVGCGKTVGTLTPKLYAKFSDPDSGQTIRGTWQWGTYAKSSDTSPGNVKTLASTTAAAGTGKWNDAALPTLAKNVTYGFRVQAKDPSPYDLSSDWSGWCKFTVDTTVPNVSVTMLTTPAGPGQAGSFRIDSTSSDVAKFSYGFTDAVVTSTKPVAKSGGGFTATVSATATDYGTNTLHVKAIDGTLNEGNASLDFDVAEPSRPVASWGLETTPSISAAGALADREPARLGDTPLSPSAVTWTPDSRLAAGSSAHFAGSTSQALASGPVVNTASSFSVAMWVRPQDAATGTQTILGKDATAGQWGSFRLQLRGGATPTWCMLMSSILTNWDNVAACLPGPVRPGTWVHVAGAYDKDSGTVRVYVDGVASAAVTVVTPQNSTGPIALGRGYNNGAGTEWFRGDLADVQIYDRVLIPADFTGHLAGDGEAPSASRAGMFQPVTVGAWTFDGVHHCPSVDSAYCAADDLSQWARRQQLTPGAEGMLQGNRGGALSLDGTDADADDDNPNPPTTTEYGVSQLSDNPSVPDAAWHNAPVLVSDQSFTVSVWVAPNDTTTTMTAVSQSGTQRSSFTLGLHSYPVGSSSELHWSFAMTASDTSTAGVADARSAVPVTDDVVGSWTHLVGVYDATTAQLTLYVNGEPAGSSGIAATWKATGPLTVGADLTSATYGNLWLGGIDDLDVFQGNMTPAQVAQLYASQEQSDAAA